MGDVYFINKIVFVSATTKKFSYVSSKGFQSTEQIISTLKYLQLKQCFAYSFHAIGIQLYTALYSHNKVIGT